MARILEQHDCEKAPDNVAIVKSGANGWLIASKDGAVLKAKVLDIKYCPFCGEVLKP